MANIKSQIKRNRQNEKRRLRNRTYRGAARTAVAQARAAVATPSANAVEEGTPETKEAIMKAISMLDKAAEKGVLHVNNASRRKGRLMKRLAVLGAAPGTTAETEAAAEEPKKTAKK